MNATGATSGERLRRFLAPAHAVTDGQNWHAMGSADTPAADALCEIYLRLDQPVDDPVEQGRIMAAGFALYGPPLAIACADWLCEQVTGRTIATVCGLPVEELQTALALAPEERYSALLVFDALTDTLNNAIANLKS